MAQKEYKVSALWYNGHGFDAISKECTTNKAALGAASQILREMDPEMVVIQNVGNRDFVKPELYTVAKNLNDEKRAE